MEIISGTDDWWQRISSNVFDNLSAKEKREYKSIVKRLKIYFEFGPAHNSFWILSVTGARILKNILFRNEETDIYIFYTCTLYIYIFIYILRAIFFIVVYNFSLLERKIYRMIPSLYWARNSRHFLSPFVIPNCFSDRKKKKKIIIITIIMVMVIVIIIIIQILQSDHLT